MPPLVKIKKSSTRKNRRGCRSTHIDTVVVSKFMTMLMTIKLYHWNTCNYAQHKATDELYESLNEHMDKFIEATLGNNKITTNKTQQWKKELDLCVPNFSLSSQDKFVNCIHEFLYFLNNTLENKYKGQNDLMNIRDEIDTDLHKFLYLMSLK